MFETISNPKDLGNLNYEHLHRFGKFLQMYLGISLRLTLYENDILHIEMRIPPNQGIPNGKNLQNIAGSWRNGERLRGAIGYKIYVYKVNHPSGFILVGKKARRAAIEKLNAAIKAGGESEPDILVTILEGEFKSKNEAFNSES